MSDLTAFRIETRDWLAENCPPEMRTAMAESNFCWGGRNFEFESPAQEAWMRAAVAKGYTVPEWAPEYGGAGLTPEQAAVLREEMAAINARMPLGSFGIWMLGPALLKFGTEEQKRHYLPQIARGEIRWCQGYSEPGSGSDLASLQTKAEDKGDYFEVTGQKVWTSYADKSDWIFCLVRSEPDAKKHEGISFLLFDMESEGVETRPIKLISGSSPFCETFFDKVRVPKDQLVGTRGKGWDIAKYLLTHERENIGSAEIDLGGTLDPVAMARDTLGLGPDGRLEDSDLRAKLGDYLIDDIGMAALADAARAYGAAGNMLGAQSAVLKYLGTELNKSRNSLMMQAGGQDALGWADAGDPVTAQNWARSKGNSIEGGTSEVMLSIISKALLRLPNLGG